MTDINEKFEAFKNAFGAAIDKFAEKLGQLLGAGQKEPE
jgi:hypothetical protein